MVRTARNAVMVIKSYIYLVCRTIYKYTKWQFPNQCIAMVIDNHFHFCETCMTWPHEITFWQVCAMFYRSVTFFTCFDEWLKYVDLWWHDNSNMAKALSLSRFLGNVLYNYNPACFLSSFNRAFLGNVLYNYNPACFLSSFNRPCCFSWRQIHFKANLYFCTVKTDEGCKTL